MFTEDSAPQLKPRDEQPLPFPDQPARLEPTTDNTSFTAPSPWWHVLKAGTVWLASVLVLVFLPVIVAIPYLVYKLVVAGPGTQEALLKDPTLILISVLAILPVHVITFAIAWFYVTSNGRYPFWKSIGFEWPQSLSPTAGVMLSVVVAVVLYALAIVFTNLWGGGKTDLDLLIESSKPARFVLAFAAVATAPLVEELIYRGVLYTALERAVGKGISIFAVSLLFAGVHVVQYRNNIAVILVITLLSFTLTTVRAATGKLLPAFIIHLVFNGIQSVLLVLGAFIDHELFK